ncbi:MAG: flavin reductase family protein [Micrococcaceae bacterium]
MNQNIENPVDVDQTLFRNVVGHFASGVTIISTAVGGEKYGTTASAVSSLSMDPPMMLICLNTSSTTHDRVAEAGRYAVNILAVEQGEIASHFARKGSDKFAGVAHQVNDDGVPLIEGALATIECEVVETASGGDAHDLHRSRARRCGVARRAAGVLPWAVWRTRVDSRGRRL